MKKLVPILLIPLFLLLAAQSCEKGTNTPDVTRKGQVEFSFLAGSLKNSYVNGLSKIIVGIEDMEGNTIVNSEEIEIYSMNGSYISKPISLLVGQYKLTRFIVLNEANEAVYASPIEGSSKAYLVENPLPIDFSANKDEVTRLNPEVLSTSESTPEDFGYATFNFQIANTFDFLVGAFIYNDTTENFQLTTAGIAIYSNDLLVYSGELQANVAIEPNNYDPLGITNKISLPEKHDSFRIEIAKPGYAAFDSTFTKEELRLHYRKEDKGPLVVILEDDSIPGLIAYYPFNGNVNDESGNGNDGTNYGVADYLTGKFDLARTFSNDPAVGVNATDYVTIPNVLPSEEFSINFWVNMQFDGNHQTLLFLSTINDWTKANLFINIDTEMKIAALVNGLDLRTSDYSHQALINGQYNDVYLNSEPLEMNKYYNIACTFNNSVLTLYVDGVEYARYLNVNTTLGSPDIPIKLGVCAHPEAGRHYYPLVGQLDELRFYDRALTDDEIQLLYQE